MPIENQSVAQVPAFPTLRVAFWYWLKLGCISFGGPAGQIAIMHHDLVDQKRWVSENRFLNALNYCMILPGPEAQQLATYIGWLMHRSWGGLIAGGLFILPSLLLLMLLSYIYLRFGHLPEIAGVLYLIKAAVIAIVLFAAHRIGTRTLKNSALKLIAFASLLAITLFSVPFPLIILLAGLIGLIGHRYAPNWLSARSPHHSTKAHHHQPALMDDNTPLPAHAIFSWARFYKVLGLGLLCWLSVIALLSACYGWKSIYSQMAWFFTKAALLTFGGAYAVLPYVFQGAVEHFHWLTATQMMDGLALGETTPGPLIMVVTFVGFVGGWTHGALTDPFTSALIAALVVTFFTFLPSFIFILIGAPFIESTQHQLKLAAPLNAITAAIVGVIVALALFFAWHLFFPTAVSQPDYLAMLFSLFGFIALWKLKLGVIQLIGLFAVVGFVLQMLHLI
jgi:chromate transporter